MSDFEQFGPIEQGEADPQALERMRERMRSNAAQIKQIKKEEGKQKKKEDKLADIIIKYLQSQDKRDLMLLVVRCLKQEIPPVFVLAILSLTETDLTDNPEIMNDTIAQISEEQAAKPTIYTNALAKIGINESALQARGMARLNKWIANLRHTADDKGLIVSHTLRESTGKIKVIAIQLMSFILRDFFTSLRIETEFKNLQAFSNFILSGVCKAVEKKSLDEISKD